MKGMKQQLITQILWSRLIAVVEEQANVLLKTAFGAITREQPREVPAGDPATVLAPLSDEAWRRALELPR